ncbi:MAG: peptidase M4 family protein [bacterium]|nr:peptidase M4 family protein [bacterium]
MRQLITIALVVCLAGSLMAAAAQQQIPATRLDMLSLEPTWQTAEIAQGRFVVPGSTVEEKAVAFISSRPDLFKLNSASQELLLTRQATDQLGQEHLRFQQRFQGLRVWGKETIVHFREDQSIYLVGGQLIPTPSLATSPAVDMATAEATARAILADSLVGESINANSELLIYPDRSGTSHLAWLVTITGGERSAIRWRVFVDARSGRELFKYNDIHFDGPAVGTGVDVNINTRTLQTYQFGPDYKLVDASRPMYQAPITNYDGVVITYDNYLGSGPITTDPNDNNNFNDNTSLRAAVSGHYYSGLTYDYFQSNFGRNSLDDNGMSIICSVHDPTYTNNAFWNGISVNFADGDGTTYKPFSGSLDVVAHELAHGVTEHTANLIYSFESGTLNESFSDVFGAMVDTANWLMGEEIRITSPGFLRNLEDPHQGPNPARFPFGYQPAHLSEYVVLTIDTDNGGVHINSGIPNRAAFIASTAIGRDKTAQIWYRTLTTYLTPGSSLNFWSSMTVQSAKDLYGFPSAEVDGIVLALDSVGFGLVAANPAAVSPMVVTLGASVDTTVTITNYRPENVNWTSVTSAQGFLTLSTSGPSTMASGDSVVVTATMDATSLSTCNLGQVEDTIVMATTNPSVPTIKVPVSIQIGYLPVALMERPITTNCLNVTLNNRPSVHDFVRASDAISRFSLLVMHENGADTSMYLDFYETPTWSTIDSLMNGTIGSDQTRTLRFASNGGKVQGKVTYQWEPSDVAGCGYVTADYAITNNCAAPLAIRSGVFGDFDVASSGSNQCYYDATNKLIWIQDPSNTIAAGVAFLSAGNPRNMRALDNPTYVWDGVIPGDMYQQMFQPTSANGPSNTDWSLLMTFGLDTLSQGDTVKYRIALLYAPGGSSGLVPILSQITPQSCCIGTTGNVNKSVAEIPDLSDLSLLISYLTITPKPSLLCLPEANVNGSVVVTPDLSDLSLLISYLTATPKPTLPACP